MVQLREQDIPVRPAVRGACEVLGLAPLHVANEGLVVAIVVPELAEAGWVTRCRGFADEALSGQFSAVSVGKRGGTTHQFQNSHLNLRVSP